MCVHISYCFVFIALVIWNFTVIKQYLPNREMYIQIEIRTTCMNPCTHFYPGPFDIANFFILINFDRPQTSFWEYNPKSMLYPELIFYWPYDTIAHLTGYLVLRTPYTWKKNIHTYVYKGYRRKSKSSQWRASMKMFKSFNHK